MEYHFKDIKKKLLEAIAEAEFIIYCAVAWITDFDIIDALIVKSKEGVKIELLVNDDDTFSSKKESFLPFIQAGGKLYLYPKGKALMHNKFCIIDLNTIITGSFNWTYSAATLHKENIIIEKDNIQASKDFAREFKELKRASIIFQAIQQAANNDIVQYFKVKDISWQIESVDGESVQTTEKNGVTRFHNDIYWIGTVYITDGVREGAFFITCREQIEIPKSVFGYWAGLMVKDNSLKLYNFVCLDPLLIRYTEN